MCRHIVTFSYVYNYFGRNMYKNALFLLKNCKNCPAISISKNDVISSVRKHYCALGIGLEFVLGLRLGLAEIRFWSNVFSSKCSRSPLPLSSPTKCPKCAKFQCPLKLLYTATVWFVDLIKLNLKVKNTDLV